MKKPATKNLSRQLTMFDDVTPPAIKPKRTTPAPVKAKKATANDPKTEMTLPPEAQTENTPEPAAAVHVTVRVSVGQVSPPIAGAKVTTITKVGAKRTPMAELDLATQEKVRKQNRLAQAKSRAKKIDNRFARLEANIPAGLNQRIRAQVDKEAKKDVSMNLGRWLARELELCLASITAIGQTFDPSRN